MVLGLGSGFWGMAGCYVDCSEEEERGGREGEGDR